MKKTLFLAAIAATAGFIMISCNRQPGSVQNLNGADTVGLARFMEWKAQQEQKMAAVSGNNAKSGGSYTMSSSSTHEAKVAKKKGWSKSAKYAVIGGTGGAVLGAVINKKDPVRGAVVGAVILGGGGYIYGRSQDKKDGRY